MQFYAIIIFLQPGHLCEHLSSVDYNTMIISHIYWPSKFQSRALCKITTAAAKFAVKSIYGEKNAAASSSFKKSQSLLIELCCAIKEKSKVQWGFQIKILQNVTRLSQNLQLCDLVTRQRAAIQQIKCLLHLELDYFNIVLQTLTFLKVRSNVCFPFHQR